jgi:hypothetical protein
MVTNLSTATELPLNKAILPQANTTARLHNNTALPQANIATLLSNTVALPKDNTTAPLPPNNMVPSALLLISLLPVVCLQSHFSLQDGKPFGTQQVSVGHISRLVTAR